MLTPIYLPICSFCVALVATYVVRGLSRKYGIVSIPREDRWNRRSIALMGGVAIFATMLVNWAILGVFNENAMFVMVSSSLLFCAGLVDDFANLKPYQKLVWQVVAVAVFMVSGSVLPWTPYPWLNTAITFVWLLGITNAVNLLDNMDGLAAGISAIAGGFLAKLFYDVGQFDEALMMLSFSATLVGFLVFNWNPATIFMGDCGSMLIGFFLGSMSLLYVSGGRFRSFVPVIAVPVLILVIPILDTLFVSILRKLAGRSIATGGQDHTSHRLVRLGIPEDRAVLLFYLLAFLSGMVGVFMTRLPLIHGGVLLLSALVGIILIGVFVAQVRVYEEADRLARDQPVVGFLVNVSQRQPVFEVAMDTVLAVIAFQIATIYHLPEGTFLPRAMLAAVAIKLSIFLGTGLYREIWRYVSLASAMIIVRSAALSALGLFAATKLLHLRLPFSMIGFDACLMFLLVLGSRISFRSLRSALRGLEQASDRERALIFGAGDAGELLCRELFHNPNARFEPVGFLDDDPLKSGRSIHRLPVFAADQLEQTLQSTNARHVILSTRKLREERIEQVTHECHLHDIGFHRIEISIRNGCESTPTGRGTPDKHPKMEFRTDPSVTIN